MCRKKLALIMGFLISLVVVCSSSYLVAAVVSPQERMAVTSPKKETILVHDAVVDELALDVDIGPQTTRTQDVDIGSQTYCGTNRIQVTGHPVVLLFQAAAKDCDIGAAQESKVEVTELAVDFPALPKLRVAQNIVTGQNVEQMATIPREWCIAEAIEAENVDTVKKKATKKRVQVARNNSLLEMPAVIHTEVLAGTGTFHGMMAANGQRAPSLSINNIEDTCAPVKKTSLGYAPTLVRV